MLSSVNQGFSKIGDVFNRCTSINDKVAILDKIVKSGQHLELLVTEYKFRYLSQNRKDIVKSVDAALLKILQYQFMNKQL
ncbi:MAG: hypothetical protein EOO42_06145 [Flavobacteriales bacterium]|nr:MAG: hypothetical protein EOO42_06145 [Flavobacteriales bacterium]